MNGHLKQLKSIVIVLGVTGIMRSKIETFFFFFCLILFLKTTLYGICLAWLAADSVVASLIID